VPLLPDYRTPELEIVALYPHRRQLSTKVRLFLDMLVDRFAEEQGWLGTAPTVLTYWVWGPSGGAFDYLFADWRSPSGGWGNP
jgi:hypothetical protein